MEWMMQPWNPQGDDRERQKGRQGDAQFEYTLPS